MKTLTVGCPVAHRDWILPQWFEHVEAACAVMGIVPNFVFVGDPTDPSMGIIETYAPNAVVIPVANQRGDDTRFWGPERYDHMAILRNLLLAAVRRLEPTWFLSLDSDILLHPLMVDLMIDSLEATFFDAVGAKCYMTPTGTACPSWANMGRENNLQRSDAEGLFRVDVIMAAKLMSPAAYHVDYQSHMHGEDIGWSLACQRAGLLLGWNGRFASKHVLGPAYLDTVDPRVGY